MTLTVFCILLFAALLHASWNAIVKAGTDKLYSAISVSGSATLIAPVLLPSLHSPLPQAGRFDRLLCLTGGLHRAGREDLSGFRYEPDLPADARHRPAAGGADQRAGARRSSLRLARSGIGVICLSILAMAMNGRMQSRKDLAGAAERLLYCGIYAGGRHRRAAVGDRAGLYAVDLLYERLLPARLGDGRASARGVRLPASALEKGLLGGVGTMGSYGLALWAMTQAPLAVVAALRETSILFGALIAFCF